MSVVALVIPADRIVEGAFRLLLTAGRPQESLFEASSSVSLAD